MKKKSSLVENTIIYGIGNFGTKILSYVMVLLYSYFVAPEDLGYYDIILTTIAMLQPLIIFQISDGVFRFLIDDKKLDRKEIINNSIKFLFMTTIISEIIFIIINTSFNFEYAFWIGSLLVTTMFFMLFQEIVRGLGKNKQYAFYGILNSTIMLIFEIIGLIVLKLGVVSLLISKVLAYSICIVIIFFKNKEIRDSLKVKTNLKKFKPILNYSAPLVPNTICWWVVNSSDRYIILYFLGTVYNGIYSISTKFPTILTTITSIFYLAWQEEAIKQYDSKEKDILFNKIFEKYYVLLFTLCLCAIPATRIVIELFVSSEYKNAWEYTGFLYLGAVFSALCSFLGIGYQVSKETSRSFFTTCFSAILNIIINVVFIKFIGLQAASFSTFIAYLFLMIIRIKHSKKYFVLKINWKKFSILFFEVLLCIFITFIVQNKLLLILFEILMILVLLKMNYVIFLPYINKLLRRKSVNV